MDRRILLLALPLALGCTARAPTVSLTSICAPPDDACTFAATCTAQYIGPVKLDASRANQLFLAVEAANQVPSNDDPSSGRVVTTDAYVQEIRVEYAGAVALPASVYRIAQTIPRNGTAVLAFPVMDVAPGSLPAGVVSAMVIAKVSAKGVFGGGDGFESAELEIPVELCDDCLGFACGAPGLNALAGCPNFTVLSDRFAQFPNSYTCP